VVQEDSERQLRVYSEALLQGSSEEVRVDAAIGLLLRQDSNGREILIKALRSSDNPLARAAVCRALIRSRGLGAAVVPAELFVEPLIDVLTGAEEGVSKLAAEALLIYRFSDIETLLSNVVKDSQRDIKVRLKGIYALQIRTEPQAFRLLIQLLDDPNPEIQQAAERSLQESFGIPIGTGRQVWMTILEQLRQKSPEDIRRERLLRQEIRLREIQEEKERWQRLYLAALDNEFELQPPEVRGKYLLERLNSDLSPIRLWALQKINRLSGRVDAALRERLLSLLGDSDREVRYQTARVLSTMSVLNPAEKLLEQHKKETDSRVGMAIFEALGEACYFALSPGSNITLPESMPAEVLGLSLTYLQSEQAASAKLGAEVLRKLLERVKVDPVQAKVYLTALIERYRQAVASDGTLAGDLLMIMARLSSQGYQKETAGGLFHQVFLEAIQEKNNPEVRLAGVTGLIGIDKTEAFRIFKEQGLASDSNPGIRQMVLDVVGQVGTSEDLDWLSALLGGNGVPDGAWQAFSAVLQRQTAEVCIEWAKKASEKGFLPERVRLLWELAEQKASAESAGALLEECWSNLLKIAETGKDYAQVIEIGKRIRSGKPRADYVNSINPILLRAALYSQQKSQADLILKEILAKEDIGSGHPVSGLIEEYLNSPEIKEDDKSLLLENLKSNFSAPDRPQWMAQIEKWVQAYSLNSNPESEKSEETSTTSNP
jgi:HEAT repeat protein